MRTECGSAVGGSGLAAKAFARRKRLPKQLATGELFKTSKTCENLGLVVEQIVHRFSALNFLRRLIEGPEIMKTP
jgi:hypothetical protein